MKRAVLTLLAGLGVLAVAACGSAAAGTTSPKASPSPSGRGARFNGAAGQLVQINGQTLILSNANGDTTVSYTSSTPITQSSTGSFADIATGVCISATGQKDSSGHVTAAQVTVRNSSSGSCAANGIFGGPNAPGGPGSGATRTPNPNRTPPPQAANLGRANGLVTAVDGTTVTVQDQSGGTTTVTVPTTVRVSRINVVEASALQTGDCVAATGQKSASGVVQAGSLTIVPAGPSGCFTGGAGGRGGFGGFGGRFPGGGGTGAGANTNA